MDKLLAYLNSLTPAEQEQFVARCNTSVGYLRKACSIKQKLGAELCVSIEQSSDGAVTRKDLRPDDWHLIWPELADKATPEPTPVDPDRRTVGEPPHVISKKRAGN